MPIKTNMFLFYNRLYLKVIATAFISIFLFNTGLQAQSIPQDEDFSGYSANNPLFVRKVAVSLNSALPLTYEYISPGSITGTSPMFLGDLGSSGLFRNGNAFYFNATTGGAIPGLGQGVPGDYRITFAPVANLNTPVGNFSLRGMYLCIGTGNVRNVTIRGYRDGIMETESTITVGDGSTISSATDISHGSNDSYSGVNLTFGTNWQFLDAIRFYVPTSDVPLMVDDLDFAPPVTTAPPWVTVTTVPLVSSSKAKIEWTDISSVSDGIAVFMKEGSTGTASPVYQTSYTANTVFGSGSQIGASGWYCVYKGKALSVDVTGLTSGVDYRVMTVAYNGAPGWETYTTGATTNIADLTTVTVPTVQASNISVTPDYTDRRKVFISWTNGNGYGRAVFVRNVTITTGPATPPVENDNHTYIAFTDSLSVTANGRVGSSGWYCVFNGRNSADNFVEMTRISVALGQTFKVMVMEYNGQPGGETYNTSIAASNLTQFIGANTPATVTLPAENILSASADVKATVDPRKGNITGIVFSYGTSPTLATTLGTISTVTPAATSILGAAAATTVITGITGLTPSTQYYYRAAATNNAGTNNGAILSFTTAPVISSVSADIADGHYKAGTVIPVTVTFTSNVVVTGTPVLSLNSGGTASYASGSGTAVLTLNYTAGAGEDVADLDVLSLALSGATVKDIYGTNASLVLPPAASLGLQKDIVIDTNVPVLSLVNIASDNSNTSLAKPGDVITLNFTSNEIILPPVVSIAGHTVTAGNTGGNNWAAVYTMVNGDAEGTQAFSISFSDKAANAGVAVTATTNASQVVFDGAAPVLSPVTIISDNANATRAKEGNTITLQFTASETIGAPVVTIAGHGVTAVNTGGHNWSGVYTMTNSDAEGLVAFDIICSDLAGNTAAAVISPSGITFDRTVPVLNPVTIVSDNATATRAKVGNTITLQFTASEAIGTPVVTIAGHGVTGVNTGGNNWAAVYTMTNSDAEAMVAFNIVCSDLAGNAAAAVTSPSGITFDRTVPVLNQVAITPPLAKTGSIITLNFTSSELITTPVVTVAGHVVNATNTGANNWSATYTMAGSDAEGVVAFNIAFSDIAGNAGIAVTSANNNVVFDRTAPSVLSINRQSPLTPITVAGTLVYRVTFSEFVKGISTSAFVLGRTGAANGTIAVVSANEGTVIDVTVNNVIAGGTLRLDMTGTGITDQAGNAITGPYSTGEQYTVNTSPAFTVSGPQAITLCSNGSVAIQDLLQTRDDDNGQTLTWTVINNAAHGAISGLPFTANTNGTNVTPTSITYTPAANYTGTDAFTVQVSDGYATATLTFQVTINAVTPAVVLAVTPGNKIPLSTPAVFTATATNGGVAPVYTFKVNGQNVQVGSLNTFSSSTLRNGDVVTCDLAGNAACASAIVVTSNSIAMEIIQPVPLYFYPNPASSIVHVSSAKPMIKIIIANGQGKIVLFKYLAEVTLEDINVGGLSAGIYYVVIVDINAGKQEGKLVIVK